MALIHCSFYSEALKIGTDVNVIIPTPHPMEDPINPGDYFHEGAKYQTLYLLHGTHGDYTDWQRFTSIELFAQLSKLMVVMPSAANSMYQDMIYGPQYFTYITEELPRFIRTLFPSSDKREDNFIAGLSMGSMGAYNCGIRRPDVYSKVIGLSGGMNMLWLNGSDDETATTQPWPFRAILPPPFDGKGTGLDDEPILRQHVKDGVELPDFYLAVGTEDFIYELSQKTRALMTELGLNFTYEEGPGVHDWVFWNTYIQKAIDWLDLKKTTV
ncbi:MAG: esterase family protein [Clostridia bacterium]|nr:esterase family protein [Clostridia bacterium]